MELYSSKQRWTPAQWKASATKLGQTGNWGALTWGGMRPENVVKPVPGQEATGNSAMVRPRPHAQYLGPVSPARCTPSAAADGAAAVNDPAAHGRVDRAPGVVTENGRPLPMLKGFDVLAYLGVGTFGEVYKAKMRDDGRIIAVKVLRKAGAQQSVEQLREVTLLKKLKHENVVALLAWRETHFNVQLLMPLYDQDLQSYIGLQGMVIGEARVVSSCLIQALAYVHGKHIIHRDLKPANILVQRQPLAAVLSDFGAGRCMPPMGVPGGAVEGLSAGVCTRWYASPEMLLGGHYSFPTDVWSLGVTMVQMECGISPFRKSSRVGMMFDILRVFGTPSMMGLSDICERQAWYGVCGNFVFPKFAPARPKPWGACYGEEFARDLDELLQLCPRRRRTALIIQRCSSWHVSRA